MGLCAWFGSHSGVGQKKTWLLLLWQWRRKERETRYSDCQDITWRRMVADTTQTMPGVYTGQKTEIPLYTSIHTKPCTQSTTMSTKYKCRSICKNYTQQKVRLVSLGTAFPYCVTKLGLCDQEHSSIFFITPRHTSVWPSRFVTESIVPTVPTRFHLRVEFV